MTTTNTHLYILLDRSGSMRAIADDVIGGFNTFLQQQQANGPDARITLVQFDSRDPQEVLLGSAPIAQAAPLSRERYQPRGGTPLLDATGRLIGRATLEEELRAANQLPKEAIVFVSITDGAENQSKDFTRDAIRRMITACQARGWTFVFLSASLEAYEEAGSMGVKNGSRQHFQHSGEGTRNAMQLLSERMSGFREKKRMGLPAEQEDFFTDGSPKTTAADRKP